MTAATDPAVAWSKARASAHGRLDLDVPASATATSQEPGATPLKATKRRIGFATWAYTLSSLSVFVWLSSWLNFWPLLILLGVAVYHAAQWALGSDAAIRALHAVPADRDRYPYLYRQVAEMSAAAGIEVPEVYVSAEPAHNAWATRLPGGAAVGFTEPLVADLDEGELRGAVAHEIGHVRNRDTLLSLVLQTLTVSIMVFVTLPGFLITAGMAAAATDKGDEQPAEFYQALMAFVTSFAAHTFIALGSRRRELLADDASVELSNPVDLARALDKIERLSREDAIKLTPALAAVAPRLFINPFAGRLISRVLSSHPSPSARIRRIHRRLPPEVAKAMATERAAKHWDDRRRALENELWLVSSWRGDTPDASVCRRHALKSTDVVYLTGQAALMQADARSSTWTVAAYGTVPVAVTSRGVHVGGDRRQNWLYERWADWECTSVDGAPALLVQRIGTRQPVGLAFTTIDSRADLSLAIQLATATDRHRASRAADLQRQLEEHMRFLPDR